MDVMDLIRRCIRIMHIARKPTDAEFAKVAKVTALGIVAFGVIGLIISLLLSSF